MLNLVTLSEQLAAQQRPAICAGYWLENSYNNDNCIGSGFSNTTSDTTSIKRNPMHAPKRASFYKESGH